MDKIERRRLARLSNLDYLGVDMVEAGNDFGPGTLYGQILTQILQISSLINSYVNCRQYSIEGWTVSTETGCS